MRRTDPRLRTVRSLAFGLCIFGLSMLGQATRADHTLVFATGANAPFHDENGTGFVDLIVEQIGMSLGHPIRVVGLPPERALQDANSGVADGDAYRIGGLGELYPNLVQVPEPIADMRFAAFSDRPGLTVRHWNDVSDLAVGYITGWKIFENNITDSAHVTAVRNSEQLFVLLVRDRADVVFYDLWQGTLLLNTDPRFAAIKPLHPPLAVQEMFLYLHDDHRALSTDVAEALRNMKSDGSYDGIFARVLEPLLDD